MTVSKTTGVVRVLEGVIGSRVVIPERCHLELVAPGDVIRPC